MPRLKHSASAVEKALLTDADAEAEQDAVEPARILDQRR